MHRKTARHDGVDRELLGIDGALAHRLDTDDLIRRHKHPIQTSLNCFGSWRNYGEAVGPALAMIELLYVTGVIEIEKLGVQGTRHIMAAQGKS